VGDGAGDGSQPSLTRDGARVAMYRSVNGNVDVWSLDTKRGAWSRLTSDPADDVYPVWSPDGSELIFSSNRTGIHNLYRRPLTAGGREEPLLATAQHKVATDWSADGRFVLFESQDPKTGGDIWALPLNGSGKPFPVVQTRFDEYAGQFSPDGRWIAYQSNESGRAEIHIQAFPGPGSSAVVSTTGGTQVHWGRDGKELFYVARDGRLTVVPIRLAAGGQAPDVGAGVPLFAPPLGNAVEQGDRRHHYMLSADSQRILVATEPDEGNEPITLILNWKPRPQPPT
jgi:eukaryotic-like serine/threonine-protein kinase